MLKILVGNFRGGCKLELTFCLGLKTKYFVLLKFRVNVFEQSLLLAIQNLFVAAENLYVNPYQSQLAKYHWQIVLWKSS